MPLCQNAHISSVNPQVVIFGTRKIPTTYRRHALHAVPVLVGGAGMGNLRRQKFATLGEEGLHSLGGNTSFQSIPSVRASCVAPGLVTTERQYSSSRITLRSVTSPRSRFSKASSSGAKMSQSLLTNGAKSFNCGRPSRYRRAQILIACPPTTMGVVGCSKTLRNSSGARAGIQPKDNSR
jgi:hypothetical protein